MKVKINEIGKTKEKRTALPDTPFATVDYEGDICIYVDYHCGTREIVTIIIQNDGHMTLGTFYYDTILREINTGDETLIEIDSLEIDYHKLEGKVK